jgi:hypothetical protein
MRLGKAALVTLSILFMATPAFGAPPQTITGGWLISRQVDPITDLGSIYLYIGSQSEYLAVGCELGQDIQIVFRTRRFLGEDRNESGREVDYRFGRNAPVSTLWEYDANAAFQTDAAEALRFLNALGGSTQLYLRLYNFQNEEIDFRFLFQDPASRLDRIRTACVPSGPK